MEIHRSAACAATFALEILGFLGSLAFQHCAVTGITKDDSLWGTFLAKKISHVL